MAVASLANRIQVNTNCANNDALYGPYNSISDAKNYIPSTLLNGKDAVGRTIGVLEDGKVVEYWWQPKDDGYDFVKKGEKVTKQEVSGDLTILPNTMYVWNSVAGELTVTKGTDSVGFVNNYMVRFTAGEECAVTFSDFELNWYGGEVPTWTAGNTYEISIVDNIALWAEFEPTQV